MLDMGFEP